MRELPGTCDAQHGELDQNPPYDAGVRALGLIAELGFTFLFSHMSVAYLGFCFHVEDQGGVVL